MGGQAVSAATSLVFPYGEGDAVHDGFARALAEALEDLGVERAAREAAVSAARPLFLCRLKDERLREALKAANFTCGIERLYHDDLRRVQRNLNEFPHDLPPDYVPAMAARRLFGRPPLRPA